MEDCRGDFRRGASAVLAAAFTAAGSVAEASMVGVDTVAGKPVRLGSTSPDEEGASMSLINIVQEMKRSAMVAGMAVALMCATAGAQQGGVSSATYTPAEQPKGKAFHKPEEAAAALFAAAKRDDEGALLIILGPDAKEIVQWSDDSAERREHRADFTQKYEQMHRLVREPDSTVALYVGAENWPLPIPLVEYQGAWYFDADLGQQEIHYRRIGKNEMEALEVCRTLVDAEKEYRTTAHRYTAKFVSTGDSRDGLYWKSADDTTRSPIGPYLAHAGVGGGDTGQSQPFHGYYYRILLQGSDDFAVVAFPAEYRSSGVMTFLVNQGGKAYEKDLGEKTSAIAKQVSSTQVDSSWKQVE